MMTAQVELDRSTRPQAGAAAVSAAMTVMTLVAAKRVSRGQSPRTVEKAATIDRSAREGDHALGDGALSEPRAEPAIPPTTRRLPTGLY